MYPAWLLLLQNTGTLEVGSGCIIQRCKGQFGGGIAAVEESSITLRNCTIRNCTGTLGGAVYVTNVATLLMDGTLLANNTADAGGGLAATLQSRTTLVSANITGNYAKSAPNKGRGLQAAAGGGRITSFATELRAAANGCCTALVPAVSSLNNMQGYTRCSRSSVGCTCVYLWHWSGGKVHNLELKLFPACAGDGGAIYLKDNSTLDFSNITSTANTADSIGNATTQLVRHNTGTTAHSRVIITGNRAKARGGGVAISGHSSFDVAAVLQASHGNSAEFDPDASVPLQRISVVGPSYISGLASR